VVPVPRGAKELVSKSKNEDVLDHFLAQVVVNSEDLVFDPVGRKRALKLSGAGKIFAERLLDLQQLSVRSLYVRMVGNRY
jgi:hypothetical protein